MLKVSGITMPLSAESDCRGGVNIGAGPLVIAVAKALGIQDEEIESVRVLRRSVDARRKNNVHFSVSVAVAMCEASMEDRLADRGIARYKPYEALDIAQASAPQRPVVVGTGPAGLFAALYLARAGLRPVVLERGDNVEQRAKSVVHFMETGQLNTQSNIQFGEGGAGTFSDGKLTTNTNNAFTPHVLHWFAEAGAPQEILWEAQPHIGSDKLPAVVATMREEIIARGGEVLFNTQLTNLVFENGRLCAIEFKQGPYEQGAEERSFLKDGQGPGSPERGTGSPERGTGSCVLPCSQLVLACGHSARDTFELLQQCGLHLEQKPFSVGVRIEHPQALINKAQWGAAAESPALGAASYKLAVHDCAGRSVYTFCMCPGGEVVCAASEEGGIATNGMSPFARDGKFANAAVLVNVGPEDFGNSADPLAGVRFQQEIEARAFQASLDAGGNAYMVPVQNVMSFLGHAHEQEDEQVAHEQGANEQKHEQRAALCSGNSCARGTVTCDLHTVLPDFVCRSIAEALPQFGRKIAGFDGADALLFAPETRSSSPVRIARNGACQSWLEGASPEDGCGIYPAGEGAGYAGGIMSAACDGLRVASALVSEL